MTKDEALTLALEALEELIAQTDANFFSVKHSHVALQNARKAVRAAKEALAQPEQEPVVCQYAVDVAMPEYRCVGKCQYTHPQQRPWVGLTDEDKDEIIRVTESDHYHDILMLAEAKLKEKNT